MNELVQPSTHVIGTYRSLKSVSQVDPSRRWRWACDWKRPKIVQHIAECEIPGNHLGVFGSGLSIKIMLIEQGLVVHQECSQRIGLPVSGAECPVHLAIDSVSLSAEVELCRTRQRTSAEAYAIKGESVPAVLGHQTLAGVF